MIRSLVTAMASMMLMCGCSNSDLTNSLQIEEVQVINTDKFQEVEYTNTEDLGFRTIRSSFIVPENITEEEVIAHIDYYIAELRQEYRDTFVILLDYYDDEVFKAYHDTPVAEVRWAPCGSIYNTFNVEGDDFSQHSLLTEYFPLDEQYNMSPEEKTIYAMVQDRALDERGTTLTVFSDPDISESLKELYIDVAESCGVGYSYILDIMEKSYFRRYRPETAYSLD